MSSFQANLELSEDDKERRDSLEYLQPVVTRSYEALMIVREYMDGGKTGKLFRGARFDKKLKTALKSLDDASKLFSMASYATQQYVASALFDAPGREMANPRPIGQSCSV